MNRIDWRKDKINDYPKGDERNSRKSIIAANDDYFEQALAA
jgi:hypothetical protein